MSKISKTMRLTAAVIFALVVVNVSVQGATPPYPPSPVMEDGTWHFDALTYGVSGNDFRPSTGADNDPSYTALVVSDHPRMLLTAEDVPALRERCRPGGERAEEYQQLKDMVDGWLDEFVIWTNRGQRRDQPLMSALVYLVEEDERYAQLAKQYLDWFIDNGEFLEYRGHGALNIAIDWIYASLSAADKQKYLTEAARYNMTWEEAQEHSAYSFPKWYPSNLNPVHDAGFLTAGLLLADDPDPIFAQAGTEILDRYGGFFTDFMAPSFNVGAGAYGGWHEDFGHTTMARTIGVLLDAWDTATGDDLLAHSTFARSMPVFLTYLQRGDGSVPARSYDPEDNNKLWTHGRSPQLWIVARRLRSPYAQRLIDRIYAPFITRVHWDILYRDDSVPEIDVNTLPLARLFDGPGYVVMRSGWAIGDHDNPSDDTFIGFQAGDWYRSHQHNDQGSFTIFKRVPLAIDQDGKSFGHAYDHNAIVVDGVDQIRSVPGYPDPDYIQPVAGTSADIADIIAFQDELDWSYVFGDVTRAYDPAVVSELTRRLVYLRPDVLVIFDRVKTVEATADVKWYLHSYAEPQTTGNLHSWDAGVTRMFARTLLPEQMEYETTQHEEKPPKVVYDLVVKPAEASTDTTFLHVISLGDPSSEAAPAQLVERDGMVGVEVVYRGRTYTVLFRRDAPITDKQAPSAGHITIEEGGTTLVDADLAAGIIQPALPQLLQHQFYLPLIGKNF